MANLRIIIIILGLISLNNIVQAGNEFTIRIDETPDNIWQELMMDYPNGSMTKEEFKKSLGPIKGLDQLEKEWEEENTLSNQSAGPGHPVRGHSGR